MENSKLADSYFEVMRWKELSREFPLTIGTKAGDRLSSILFIITLDKSLKEVYKRAIISYKHRGRTAHFTIAIFGTCDKGIVSTVEMF